MKLTRAIIFSIAFSLNIHVELGKFKNVFPYNLAMAQTFATSLDELIDKAGKTNLWKAYADNQHKLMIRVPFEEVQKAIGSVRDSLQKGNKPESLYGAYGQAFVDLIKPYVKPIEKVAPKAPPVPVRTEPAREAPKPVLVTITDDQILKPFRGGNAQNLINASKINEHLIGGNYTTKNSKIEVGRINAVQTIAVELVRSLIEKDADSLFSRYLDKNKGSSTILNRIYDTGEVKLTSGKYDRETKELVAFLQKYLNNKPDARYTNYTTAMEQFNGFLKSNQKSLGPEYEDLDTGKTTLNANGVVGIKEIFAFQAFYCLVNNIPLTMPSGSIVPPVGKSEPKVPPAGEVEKPKPKTGPVTDQEVLDRPIFRP